jgi:hypothetical protein
LIALLWAGKIHLPLKEEMEAWESRRLAETGDRGFYLLAKASERVVYWDELNELAAEYLGEENADDVLLRSFPFKWIVELSSRGRFRRSCTVSRTMCWGWALWEHL